MRMYDLIEKKKHGVALSREEIFEMISLYTEEKIPDYQMSALTMAIYFRGMTDEETFALTEAMAKSGDTVDLSRFGDRSVDKHSTGGVGDKTTLIVAPIVAAAGGVVAKMSGRGLGHTGGTVDKLESFPGFRTSLSPEEFADQSERVGLAVIGQSADLAPADKRLYALRDVTATVDSLPLIASSIMSKKLAAGTRSIVLDVKCGSGAFMRTPEDATRLAETMVHIGIAHGKNTAAVITNMDVPLGHAIGNAMEVTEAIEVLRGGGPDDLRTVCLTLATRMIALSCKKSIEEAHKIAEDCLYGGKAYTKFCEWIESQGGDPAYARDPALFGRAAHTGEVCAEEDCYISACNAELIGTAAMILGAGRQTKDSVIDPRAGVLLLKKPGDRVNAGEVIARLFTERAATLDTAADTVRAALTFSDTAIEKQPLIYAVIDNCAVFSKEDPSQ
ncbi:MAG: thymidine phosphorylase [Clostridia bacterium]|nr:thymidine phosphorylase [Clostridia bacterium]